MNIQELLKATGGATSITLSVTPADLKEFALAVVDEVRNADENVRKQEKEKVDAAGDEDPLFTQTEAAEYLAVSKSTLWRWKQMGYLNPVTKIGARPMYSKADLDAIINNEMNIDK